MHGFLAEGCWGLQVWGTSNGVVQLHVVDMEQAEELFVLLTVSEFLLENK